MLRAASALQIVRPRRAPALLAWSSSAAAPRSDAQWEPVIGLEFHVQIASSQKLFSDASTDYFHSAPNSNVALFDAAIPGSMPKLNAEPVHLAIRAALALSAHVNLRSTFDRKHYFYADLPSGYQITQKHRPLAQGGFIPLTVFDGLTEARQVRLEQIQLEQDTGKSVHDAHPTYTLLDLNRAGTGLMEIVTYPDIRLPVEAGATLKNLQAMLRAVGAADASLEEGGLRCDANVSLRQTDAALGTKVEVKNLGTVSGLVSALEFEIQRQQSLLGRGEAIVAETRGYDASTGETFSMRQKEAARDYRFMPDADLPALLISPTTVSSTRASLPELPHARKERYRQSHGLSVSDINVITEVEGGSAYFDQMLQDKGRQRDAQKCCNWLTTELMGRLERQELSLAQSPVIPEQLGSIVDEIQSGRTSSKMAKQVLDIMFQDVSARGKLAGDILHAKGWVMITDSATLARLCDDVIAQSPEQVAKLQKTGNVGRLLGWFVGQAMALSGGLAHPETLSRLMKERLEECMIDDR
ncbi:hypothetical protein RI367_004901 [Sorochytrium milnesiophthora]